MLKFATRLAKKPDSSGATEPKLGPGVFSFTRSPLTRVLSKNVGRGRQPTTCKGLLQQLNLSRGSTMLHRVTRLIYTTRFRVDQVYFIRELYTAYRVHVERSYSQVLPGCLVWVIRESDPITSKSLYIGLRVQPWMCLICSGVDDALGT